ncbi:hypothetical protein RND81_04G232300 [Saponaria officinalis]|uniref:KIB1-4 beta-propeller domain-containing protein n=1 Tax=Saponaria officinalis TaxID=3572 RepID=A0AAW1LGW3_SAPOF
MIVVNWSLLQIDLLIQIVENHLTSVDDVIVFSSVCRSWNCATRACNKLKLRQNWLGRQMPWLMLTDGNDDEVYSDAGSYIDHMFENNVLGLSDEDEDEDLSDEDDLIQEVQCDENELLVDSCYYSDINDGIRKLFNLSHCHNKSYNLSLPQLYGKACWGSRYGWMVTLGLDRRMHLFNPLTKAQLPLPSQTTFRYPWSRARDKTIRVLFLTKVVLLRVPQADREDDNESSWLVVAIHRSYSLVAIARPGDAAWTHLKWPDGLHILMDVIYCTKLKSLLFIDADGDLFYYDVHNSKQPQEFKEYLNGPDDVSKGLPNNGTIEPYMYLVQCGDILLVIARYKRHYFVNDRKYKTQDFKVFRLCSPDTSWEELSHLGNIALFVGGNETMCIDASDGGCRSNCIYFCDEECKSFRFNRDKVGGRDMGVFSLSRKTIEPIYEGNNRKSSHCSPFWFSPSIF